MTKPPYHDDQASFSAPIEDLQVRIAFLDDLVEELNQQLAIQTLEIADLKKTNAITLSTCGICRFIRRCCTF